MAKSILFVNKNVFSVSLCSKYENTIVIFLSDNGPNGYRWNSEMKERKGSTNEGGVRVPFFIQWPKKIPKGIIHRDLFIDNIFFYKTIVGPEHHGF